MPVKVGMKETARISGTRRYVVFYTAPAARRLETTFMCVR
jgi:hypothetical protein